jgi:endonuclease VIII
MPEGHTIHRAARDQRPMLLGKVLNIASPQGRFRAAKIPACEPRGEVRVRMVSDTHVVDINGPNTCELIDPAQVAALTKRIGPDVLRKDAISIISNQRKMVPRAGIEPATRGFSIRCSTN